MALGGSQQILLIAGAALVISSGGLLVRASQVNGHTLYDKFTVTLLSEATKLAIALLRWSTERGQADRGVVPCSFLTRNEAALYALPASLYVFVNNLRFPILERINPGVLSVVWNLKVVGVAFLLAYFLRRPMTRRKWCGVVALLLGSTLAELSQWKIGDKHVSTADIDPESREGSSTGLLAESAESHQQKGYDKEVEGLILVAIGLVAVSIANVSCEYCYKRSWSSVNVGLAEQNAVLYTYGVALNGLAIALFSPNPEVVRRGGMFHDFTAWTVAVVLSQSIGGYLIGALFKHIDAIAAIYADLAAMLISAVVSTLFFDLRANGMFIAGFLLSICSFWIYYGGQSADSDNPTIEAGTQSSEIQGLLAAASEDENHDSNDSGCHGGRISMPGEIDRQRP